MLETPPKRIEDLSEMGLLNLKLLSLIWAGLAVKPEAGILGFE